MGNKNSVVSIIIPVYNAEESLHNCVESVLDQTYQHIEIIMVNDGSTDCSKDICEYYASMDQRIKVIHQQNAGPSAARNKGIEHATGDYIQFIDADDYMKPIMTEELVKAMSKNAQLVICGYQAIYGTLLKKYMPSRTGVYKQSDFMQYIGELYKDILLPSPCNKLYDATLINQFQLRFLEHIKVGEDLLFNLAYIKICPAIRIIDSLLYNYVIQDDHSLSRAFNKNFFANQRMLHDQVKTFLQRESYYSKKNKYFLNVIYANSIINSLGNLFHQNSALTATEKKEQIREIIANVNLKQEVDFNNSVQAKIIGQMIKMKSVHQIYLFFRLKMSSSFQRFKWKLWR